MKSEIGQLLREGDPLRREGDLSQDAVRRMRGVVIGEALAHSGEVRGAATSFWPRPLFVTVTMAATLVVAVLIGRRLPMPTDGASSKASVQRDGDPQSAEGRRQLQFSTPGGTRIIWVFDSKFSL